MALSKIDSNSLTTLTDLAMTGGITFDSRTNALDDYEEGTWTLSLATVSGVNYSTQTGNYTKIGDTVFLQGKITFTGTITGGTNIRFVAPFTPIGSGTFETAGPIGNATAIVSGERTDIYMSFYAGTTNLYIYNHGGGVLSTASSWQAGTLNFSITYKV